MKKEIEIPDICRRCVNTTCVNIPGDWGRFMVVGLIEKANLERTRYVPENIQQCEWYIKFTGMENKPFVEDEP